MIHVHFYPKQREGWQAQLAADGVIVVDFYQSNGGGLNGRQRYPVPNSGRRQQWSP